MICRSVSYAQGMNKEAHHPHDRGENDFVSLFNESASSIETEEKRNIFK
jgi:hypothetical protein